MSEEINENPKITENQKKELNENIPSPSADKVEPLLQDYADSLVEKLGDSYDKELDSYDLKERIKIMKHMVKLVPKKANKSNIPNPIPNGKDEEKSSKLPIKGIDWRKFRK